MSFMNQKTIISLAVSFFILATILAEFLPLNFQKNFFTQSIIFLILILNFLLAFYLPQKKIYFLIFTFFFLGLLRFSFYTHLPQKNDIDFYASFSKQKAEEISFLGIVCDLPQIYPQKIKFIVCAQNFKNQKIKGKVLVHSKKTDLKIDYGTKVKVTGKLLLPDKIDNFSYQDFLATKGIFSFMTNAYIEKFSDQQGNKILTFLFNFKKKFEKNIAFYIPYPENLFASGILLGERKQMPQKTLQDFKTTGLLHLLALSGSNITILIVVVFWLLSRFPKKIAISVTAIVITLFTLLVGSGSSIVRAALMGVLGMIILHSGRQAHSGFLLLLTCFLMIFHNPKILLFDVSFQLSVAGTAGLIFFVPILKSLKFFQNLPKTFALQEAVLCTIAAQITVVPLAAFYFQTFSLSSFVANPLVAPFIPLGMLLAFLTGSMAFFSMTLAKIIAFFAFYLLHLPLKIAAFFADIPYSQIFLKINLLTLLFLYGIIFCFWFYGQKKINFNNL